MNLEGLIPLLGGIYLSLAAYGYIALGKSPAKNEQWLRQWGKMLRILAPLVAIFGLLRLFRLL